MRLSATAFLLLAWLQPQEASFLTMSDDERREWIINQAAEYEARTDETAERLRREEPGVDFKRIPIAPVPAETRVRRLVQMRQLANRFAASVKARSGDLNLRLMPQPMIRYTPQETNVMDGAVFSFSKGTNPEVLLMIEAEIDDGRLHFVYSPARMTSRACRLTMDTEEVWSVTKVRGDALRGTYRNLYTP